MLPGRKYLVRSHAAGELATLQSDIDRSNFKLFHNASGHKTFPSCPVLTPQLSLTFYSFSVIELDDKSPWSDAVHSGALPEICSKTLEDSLLTNHVMRSFNLDSESGRPSVRGDLLEGSSVIIVHVVSLCDSAAQTNILWLHALLLEEQCEHVCQLHCVLLYLFGGSLLISAATWIACFSGTNMSGTKDPASHTVSGPLLCQVSCVFSWLNIVNHRNQRDSTGTPAEARSYSVWPPQSLLLHVECKSQTLKGSDDSISCVVGISQWSGVF